MEQLWTISALILSYTGKSTGTGNIFDPEQMKEGNCFDFKLDPNLNSAWLQEQNARGWYYLMGSRLHVLGMTESLTGKRPTSLDSLNGSCVHVIKTSAGYAAYGYGNKADYECHKAGRARTQECFPTDSSTNSMWAVKRGLSRGVVGWTDNRNYVLGLRCVAFQRAWALLSTSPTLDSETKEKVLEYLSGNGFDPEKAVLLPHENCPEFKPF